MPDVGTISFGGLATGLDTKTLISQLVGLAQQPIQRLEQSRSLDQKKISTFQEFNGKLLTLKTTSQKLLNSTDFFARTNTVSDDTKLDASVTSTAQTGNYTIAINDLAKTGQKTFEGVADLTTQTLSGTFTIRNAATNSTSFTISLDTNGMSLERLRDAINNDSNNNGKLTATILDTSSGAYRYRLQIKGNTTGTANDFDVTEAASLTLDADANVTFATGNASFTVDGVTLMRSSNTVSDAISGVTLTLKSKTTTAATLTVSNDTATMQANVKAFVSAYNDVRAYINAHSTVDQQNPQNNGLFLGDGTVRDINSRLQQAMTGAVAGLAGDYDALNDLGITTDKDGRLVVDDTKLATALATNVDHVSKIFIGSDGVTGLAARVDTELDNFTNPVGGLINIHVGGIQEQVKGLNARIDLMQQRLKTYQNTLGQQFSALEQLISSLQVQGNSLGSPSNR
jgi:flagellar hook-associated protein 2